ncbi:MAG: DUF5132 domain-containing protein [Spirulina sp.]
MLNPHHTPVSLRTRVAELASHPSAKTLAIGVAAVAITPIVLPLVKPALKATIKSGVTLYERAKIAVAETAEALADVAAEARAEVRGDVHPPTSLPAAAPTEPAPAE